MKVLFEDDPMHLPIPDMFGLGLSEPIGPAVSAHVRKHLKPAERGRYSVHYTAGQPAGFVRIGLTKEDRRIPFVVKGIRRT